MHIYTGGIERVNTPSTLMEPLPSLDITSAQTVFVCVDIMYQHIAKAADIDYNMLDNVLGIYTNVMNVLIKQLCTFCEVNEHPYSTKAGVNPKQVKLYTRMTCGVVQSVEMAYSSIHVFAHTHLK